MSTTVVELRDGSFDFEALERNTRAVATAAAEVQPRLQRLVSPYRAGVPQIRLAVDRAKAETLGVSVGDAFAALGAFAGSAYVNQFNRSGCSFQVYVQADQASRRQASARGRRSVS